MAKNDALFPNEYAMAEGFSEGRQDLKRAQGGNSGTRPTDQAWSIGKGPDGLEEHTEDPDDPCRSALMDCYNR